MPEAQDIFGSAFKRGSAILLARVVGTDAAPVTRAAIATVSYSIYLLDEQDPDSQTEVEGHVDEVLSVAEVIFDALQTDAVWTRDALGYNFKHVLPVGEHPAFPVAGRSYRVQYALEPQSDPPILVRFRVHVI